MKFVPQPGPAKTLTLRALATPEIVPLPVIDQEYELIPSGAVNWLLELGQTSAEPAIEHAGKGLTVSKTSFVSVQPFNSKTVRRRVAEAEETRAVVSREPGESMVALPETTLQVVDATGCNPAPAVPCRGKAVEVPSLQRA